MLTELLLASVLAAGSLKIRVEVIDYGNGKPLAGAKVTLSDETGPKELQTVSDDKGRAWFDVPHLGFSPVEVDKQGYVTRAEMKPWEKEVGLVASKEQRGGQELFWRVTVFPRSYWNTKYKMLTRDEVLARADEWGRECRSGGPVKVEYYEPGYSYTVTYSCLRVLVSAKGGATNVLAKRPVTATPIYTPQEALQDALSSPLEFLARLQSDPHDVPQCAYKNKTVFVLNNYCTKKEINSTGIDIIHPERGRVHLYAEAKSPISSTSRDDYDVWHFKTEDPYPGASIAMSWPEIEKHEIRRHVFLDASCWADLRSERGGSCTNKTEDILKAWPAVYRPMLEQPPPEWLALVRLLRSLAARGGKPDPRGEPQNPVMPPSPPLTTAGGSGPYRITVEVEEYMLGKPVADAKVTLRDPSGRNPDLTGMTNPRGKLRFDAQTLEYQLASIDHPAILSKDELAPIKDLFKSIDVRRSPHGVDGIKLEQLVVNRKWLDATMKVRTAQQAVQIAHTWGQECGSPPTQVTRPSSWKVEYPCVVVHVDAWEGEDRDPTVKKLTPDVTSAKPLYPPLEALADALASPLRHLGTGVWPGRYKIPSCAYRNDKVVVVDGYCTLREMNPTTIWIFHPERGVVVFSASGDQGALVSKVKRPDYEQWTFGTYELYPGLELDMTFRELTDWEKRRGVFGRGGCGGGLRSASATRGSCGLKTPEIDRWWQAYYPPLLDTAPDGWYQLSKQVRAMAPKYGKKDPRNE